MFWKEWTIQFGSNLPTIIDRRGLVDWKYRSRPDNKTSGDKNVLKGYKVRTWRCWGESGKNYHRIVNRRRKTQSEDLRKANSFEPTIAEEVTTIKWTSPFSNARRYHFKYRGIEFCWEGTRDLPAMDIWSKRLMPLNHLKLIAQIPGKQRIFIGYYASSVCSKKFGRLFICNSAIARALEESGSSLATGAVASEKGCEFAPEPDIRRSRIYDLVMASAMCMIIGEWQKRITVFFVLALIAESGKGTNLAAAGGGS